MPRSRHGEGLWTGAVTASGYGCFAVDTKPHEPRWNTAWATTTAPVPSTYPIVSYYWWLVASVAITRISQLS